MKKYVWRLRNKKLFHIVSDASKRANTEGGENSWQRKLKLRKKRLRKRRDKFISLLPPRRLLTSMRISSRFLRLPLVWSPQTNLFWFCPPWRTWNLPRSTSLKHWSDLIFRGNTHLRLFRLKWALIVSIVWFAYRRLRDSLIGVFAQHPSLLCLIPQMFRNRLRRWFIRRRNRWGSRVRFLRWERRGKSMPRFLRFLYWHLSARIFVRGWRAIGKNKQKRCLRGLFRGNSVSWEWCLLGFDAGC